MPPYRDNATPAPSDERPRAGEELIVYAVLAAVGALPVAGALRDHAAFHAEATIGLVMLIAGVIGLLAALCDTVLRRG